ncbi:Hypothetical protein GLP15_988 [Giardia lamblia P15]|uniref:Uncharacterized protein n=1 Tax=Giardia intestinalis (strain P15) TaxID=658858 RepID=E1F344_GIAIA|nr:Hypothetical protein GLP15_988 [Giardia lamblia P15]
MKGSPLDDSSVNIELIHPIRLDDIDSGVLQLSQNPSNQVTQSASLSASVHAPYFSTYDPSLVSMQLACSDSSSDDLIDMATFATPTVHTSRIGSAPVVPYHRTATSISLGASLAESLGSGAGLNHTRSNTSPVSAGSSRATRTNRVHLDPPTNTPSTSGRTYKSTSPIENATINRALPLTQLSRRSAFDSKTPSAIYTMTKVPQVVCFTSTSPARQQSRRSSLSAGPNQVQRYQSSPPATVRQRHNSSSLYPLSCANKLLKEPGNLPSFKRNTICTNRTTPSPTTPTIHLRPSPRPKSPTRPTTVSSIPSSNPNSNKRTANSIAQKLPLSPKKVSSTRPVSHLIVRSSPLLKLGGSINSPWTSAPIEFPLQIRNIGSTSHGLLKRSTSIPNTPRSVDITIHKDKRFRPVSPDGNTFITIFSPTINNPSNPVTFHLNETTVVTKTSVGWIKVNNDCKCRKSKNVSSPRGFATTNRCG